MAEDEERERPTQGDRSDGQRRGVHRLEKKMSHAHLNLGAGPSHCEAKNPTSRAHEFRSECAINVIDEW
jgi:hypothetical protein